MPDQDEKKFHVWLFHTTIKASDPFRVGGHYDEPVEAVDDAERMLKSHGIPGQSYAEIRFNGAPQAHHVVTYQPDRSMGLMNTAATLWPISIPDYGSGWLMLDKFPFQEDAEATWKSGKGGNEKPTTMKLDPKEEDKDEGTDPHDAARDEEGARDEKASQDKGGGKESQEFPTEDEDDDEEGNEEGDEEDFQDGLPGGVGGEQGDSQREESQDEDDGDGGEDEVEMPRLKFFARFLNRKRAETDPDSEAAGRFTLKIGRLNEEAETKREQEADRLVFLSFVETAEDTTKATLKLTLPSSAVESMKVSSMKVSGGKTLTFEIPVWEDDE